MALSHQEQAPISPDSESSDTIERMFSAAAHDRLEYELTCAERDTAGQSVNDHEAAASTKHGRREKPRRGVGDRAVEMARSHDYLHVRALGAWLRLNQ
jgi:hypothetical protein